MGAYDSVAEIKEDLFRGPDGKIDYAAWRKARVQNGEYCLDCRGFILFPKGRPAVCEDCRRLKENHGEVGSDRLIRCPACRKTWRPSDYEQYDTLEDGDHEVSCPHCDHEFTVSTSVTYTFTSPAVKADKKEPQDE
jgi:ssDNA-binding Zn-finger/Zn-ribbon topoisomerase 1